jgi:hypothetical protein
LLRVSGRAGLTRDAVAKPAITHEHATDYEIGISGIFDILQLCFTSFQPMKNIENFHYENWLSLKEKEKKEMFQKWNTYDGEGYPIAIMTLARLVNFSCLPINQANVGIYHGGTYLLKASLAASWDGSNQIDLVNEFEGFPVIWANFRNEWVGGFRMGG